MMSTYYCVKNWGYVAIQMYSKINDQLKASYEKRTDQKRIEATQIKV